MPFNLPETNLNHLLFHICTVSVAVVGLVVVNVRSRAGSPFIATLIISFLVMTVVLVYRLYMVKNSTNLEDKDTNLLRRTFTQSAAFAACDRLQYHVRGLDNKGNAHYMVILKAVEASSNGQVVAQAGPGGQPPPLSKEEIEVFNILTGHLFMPDVLGILVSSGELVDAVCIVMDDLKKVSADVRSFLARRALVTRWWKLLRCHGGAEHKVPSFELSQRCRAFISKTSRGGAPCDNTTATADELEHMALLAASSSASRRVAVQAGEMKDLKV
jgi:hypothetical protein